MNQVTILKFVQRQQKAGLPIFNINNKLLVETLCFQRCYYYEIIDNAPKDLLQYKAYGLFRETIGS